MSSLTQDSKGLIDTNNFAGKPHQHRAQLLDHRMIALGESSAGLNGLALDHQRFLFSFSSLLLFSSFSSLRYGRRHFMNL
jgi:hypothetical protein